MLRLRLADYRYGLLFMLQAGAEESERQGRKKRGGGDLHTHLWWAVISWPYSPASQEGERFRLLLEHLGGRLNSGQVGVLQPQPAGAAEKPLPLPLLLSLSLSMCVCGGLKCLPSSFHCCSSGCSQGCVARLWETQPLSGLLSWYYTKGVFLGEDWGGFGL